jgi:hypothetical protein
MKASIFLMTLVGLCTAAAASELGNAKTPSFISQRRSALEQPATPAANGSCPQVWYDIAADLKSSFFGCTRSAADAIRFAFHDAGEWLLELRCAWSRTDQACTAGYSSKNQPYSPASGGADGSLLLNDGEIGRSINDPLQGYRDFLLGKYNQYKSKGVGAADFVQAAGNLGTRSCPGGPTVKTVSNILLKNLAVDVSCSSVS